MSAEAGKLFEPNGRPAEAPVQWIIIELRVPEDVERGPIAKAIEKALPGAKVRVISMRRAT